MKKSLFILFAITNCTFLYAQNVGIGIANPLDKVDVDGSMRLTGTG